jgi:anti-sigma-K factor RskA
MNGAHDWKDYAASYALDALTDEDRAVFEAHLATCDGCRDDVDAYREAAAAIAHATPQRSPPAALRERVLRDARAVRPLGAARTATRVRATPSALPAALPARSRRATLAPWLLAAASLVIAVGALALYAATRGRTSTLEDRVAQVERLVADRDARIASLDAAVAARDSLLADALDPATETATLVSAGRPPAVRLYRNPRRARMVVAAADLPPAPAGRTYQLWGLGDGAPVSLGTFDTSADGRALVALPLDLAQSFDLSAITEEPAGGSAAPTTTPFLIGSWTAR